MVFSERVPAKGGIQPLKAINVLAIIYAFGGVSALCAILSKFVVGPLFQQLVHDRQIYVREARDKLLDLNFTLEKMVSSVPKQHHGKRYVDAATQTSREKTKEVIEEGNDWEQFENTFKFSSNIDMSGSERQIISSLDNTEQYLRALLYGQIRNFKSTNINKAREAPDSDPVLAIKQEIRSLKGAVLSL